MFFFFFFFFCFSYTLNFVSKFCEEFVFIEITRNEFLAKTFLKSKITMLFLLIIVAIYGFHINAQRNMRNMYLDDPKGVITGNKRMIDQVAEFTDLGYDYENGNIWPKPQYESRSDKLYTLDPKTFKFVFKEKNWIIKKAINRYKKLAFPNEHFRVDKKLKQINTIDISIEDLNESLTLESNESYILKISYPQSTLEAKSIWGALRGLETFSQVVHRNGSSYVASETVVRDFPRFKYRGFLIDTSRHFLPVSQIFQILDALAYSKFNVLHWHIVDDQSFPFVSKKFPELHKKGAFNQKTHVYNPKQVQDIIHYAKLLGIRVVPEFNTPGHTHSWNGIPGLLTECSSTNQREKAFEDMKGPINPIKNASFVFLKDFFSYVPPRFEQVGVDKDNVECFGKTGVWQGYIDTTRFYNHDETPKFINYRVDGNPNGLVHAGRGESCQVENAKKNNIKQPVVVLSDGHSSRFDSDVLTFLRSKNIRLFITPPDKTGVTQLVDQINQKLHTEYRSAKCTLFSGYDNQQRNGGLSVKWMQEDKFLRAELCIHENTEKDHISTAVTVSSPKDSLWLSKSKHKKCIGTPTIFTYDEEQLFSSRIKVMCDSGFPLNKLDVKILEHEGIVPCNIWNYESNLRDDPGNKKVVIKRGTKYPERIMNSSKAFFSVMFRENGVGEILPPYTISEVFPDEYIHIGGDEVDFKCWLSNSVIKKWLANNGNGTSNSERHNEATLHKYYFNKLIKIINRLKKKYIVWQDVFESGAVIEKDAIVNVWKHHWKKEMSRVTKAGHKVVLSSCWYLNYVSYGLDWPKFYTCDPQGFNGSKKEKDLVIGGSCAIWGEYVDATNIIQRSFGRAFAVAERLWSSEDTVSISEALIRIWEHRCRYIDRGIPTEPVTRSKFCRNEYER
ncbi:beta-hexosaminidase subunit alpha isoform X2 [Hydra vulgaris]|uniref:beta-N-acetylhexosaminidase n=1 Tax=Hydra vulgaris TaxID=6087 RepID=A0ABM4CM00_HYDVU